MTGVRWQPARVAGTVILSAILGLTSCATRQQSIVDPAGPQSDKIAALWWVFFWLSAAIFVVVMALTLWTLTRRHRGFKQEPLETRHIPSAETEHRMSRVVAAATIATVLILFILLIASVGTGKAVSNLGNKNNGMTIEVTGNQWWWHIRYQ